MEIGVKKVNIYDVAKAAACSAATVSLALNGDRRVKEETRQQIIGIAKQLRYEPSFFGKGLKNKKTKTLGLLVPDLKNPVFSDMIEGAEDYANNHGYHLIVGVSSLNMEKEIFYLNMLRENRVDGMIILPTFLDVIKKELIRLKNANFPFVLSGVPMDDIKVNYVSCNMEEGAYMAVSHLIEKGHRSIAFISGAASTSQNCGRLNGYRKALESHGFDFAKENVFECGPQIRDAYQTAHELLKKRKDITSAFCLCDYIALGVVNAVLAEGRRIPKNFAVVGYDNISMAEHFPVPLTTVETHNRRVGETAAKILIEQIDGLECDFQQVILSPKLIVRNSS